MNLQERNEAILALLKRDARIPVQEIADRLVLQPQEVSQEQAQLLAREMALRIQTEMRFPGQIRVTVIRETRAVEYAG